MINNSKFNKKAKISYLLASAATCLAFLFIHPIIDQTDYRSGGYYLLTINKTCVGSVSSPEIAREIVSCARKTIAGTADDLVLMNVDYQVAKSNKIFGRVDSLEKVEKITKAVLQNSIIESEKRAYTLKVGDYSVTLGSKEDVLALLEASKAKYDQHNTFQIELVPSTNSQLNVLTTKVVKADVSKKNIQQVAATQSVADVKQEENAQTTSLAEGAEASPSTQKDGVVSLGFDQSIEVMETYASDREITPLQKAIDEVTKNKETNQVYEVTNGDCVSVVAQKNNMSVEKLIQLNQEIGENTVLQEGDELVVTTPEPELSVITQEKQTYQEEYQLETQYIDNDSWYTTKQETLQESETGTRGVEAVVTYRNGTETGRNIVKETIVKEAKPKIVERGTQAPPTFMKPLTGGRFTSGFGVRWGRMHEGIDWATPVGTAIKASCGGTVVSAGWSNGYGNCIVISHSDGKQTRYGHLSKLLVTSGQKVSQGEKIALSGNTGHSTGPHVHFEIIEGGRQVNPLKYLN